MKKHLKILVVEDSENDTLLEIRQIERAGYDVEFRRVETKDEVESALSSNGWDLILSDFTMPSLTGTEALKIVRAKDEFIPFIFVSGTIGEDRAVGTLKNGANDYILKIDPNRLVASIEKELRERDLRLEKAKALVDLRKSEEMFRLLSEAAYEAIAFHDKGMLIRANNQYFNLFGYEPEELLGKDIVSLVIAPESLKLVADHIANGFLGTYEAIGIKKDGTKFSFETKARTMELNGKEIRVAAILDISDRKRIEGNLRLQASALEAAANSIIITDPDGIIKWVNPAFAKMTGYTAEEAIGRNPRFLRSGFQPEIIYRDLWESITTGNVWHNELVNRKKDGATYTEEMTITPIIDANGKIKNYIAVKQDVSERKQADETARELTQRISLATELAQVGIWDLDLETFSAVCDRKMSEILGFCEPKTISLEDWERLLSPEDIKKTNDVLQRAIVTREPQTLEFEVKLPDGKIRTVESGIGVMVDSKGKVTHTVGAALDVTERYKSIERIREQAALLDESHDAISVLDLSSRVVFWSRGAEELYGWSAEEVCGKNKIGLSVEGEGGDEKVENERLNSGSADFSFVGEVNREAISSTLASGHWEGELNQKTRFGKVITVLSRWTLLRDKLGGPKSILIISTDITSQKALEVQFRRSQRMEMLGTLASAIAHDLNNVLTPIVLALEILHRKYSDDEKTVKLLATLESTVNRGTGAVKQILAFARGNEPKKEVLDPRTIMGDMKRIIEEKFPKSVTLDIMVAEDIRRILADKTQIHQVIMNLCINAKDAMPKGGKLTLIARDVMIDEQYAEMSPSARPGSYVLIEVTDTGVGIKREHMDRLFEPFFTTKGAGKRTGLGLSIVQEIVDAHNGFIEVESELTKGSTFKIYLPLFKGEDLAPQPEAEEKPRQAHGETILVVDDEAAIRDITKSTLEAYGYAVHLASDGSEAVALFAQHKDEIALVITDMAMPVMDGAATIRALRKIRPDLKIIAATGYSESIRQYDLVSTINALLKKPYTAKMLLETITNVLGNLDPR